MPASIPAVHKTRPNSARSFFTVIITSKVIGVLRNMRNTDNMIIEGSNAIDRNKSMGLTAAEVQAIKEESAADVYLFGEKMFYAGVALGLRIAAKERRNNED